MDNPQTIPIFSNSMIVLVSLLCALVCVVGLMAAARCSSRFCGGQRDASALPLHNRGGGGLKKTAINSLPKLTYKNLKLTPEEEVEAADCVICLSEFVNGDEIRVLPHCNHAFHVACVDTWLKSHSTCPSCRRNLATAVPCRCAKNRPVQLDPQFLP